MMVKITKMQGGKNKEAHPRNKYLIARKQIPRLMQCQAMGEVIIANDMVGWPNSSQEVVG